MSSGRSVFTLKTRTSFIAELKAAAKRNKSSKDSVDVMIRYPASVPQLGDPLNVATGTCYHILANDSVHVVFPGRQH